MTQHRSRLLSGGVVVLFSDWWDEFWVWSSILTHTWSLYKMAEYDLTSKIGGYLDRHLVFPMLEFLTEKKVKVTLFLWSHLKYWRLLLDT